MFFPLVFPFLAFFDFQIGKMESVEELLCSFGSDRSRFGLGGLDPLSVGLGLSNMSARLGFFFVTLQVREDFFRLGGLQ